MLRLLQAATLAVAVSLPTSVVTATPAQADSTTARKLALKLVTRAETGSGYDRTKFSNDTWRDTNGDCQNTRAEVLIAESKATVRYTTSRRCTVKSGKWFSWYDQKYWTNPSDVDIDHVVALKEAWDSGAKNWSSNNRERYYNDLGHGWTLDAVTDNVNSSKSDRDPADWLPPAGSNCKYAIHWVTIKYRWGLSLDSAERSALLGILSGSCGERSVTIPARAR